MTARKRLLLAAVVLCTLALEGSHGSLIPVIEHSLVSLDKEDFLEPVFGGSGKVRRRLSSSSEDLGRDLPDSLQLNIVLPGEELTYTLDRNMGVFTPGAKVYVQGENGVEVHEAGSLSSSVVNYKGANIVLSVRNKTFDGIVIHNSLVVKFHRIAEQLYLETQHKVAGYCGSNANYSIDPTEDIPIGELTGHSHSRRVLIDRWTNCYPNDATKRSFRIGLAVTNHVFSRELGSNAATARTWLEGVIAKANTVYGAQLNIDLTIGAVFIEADTTPADSCISGNVCEWKNAAVSPYILEQITSPHLVFNSVPWI